MITAEDRIKYEYYTDSSIFGTKLVAGLRNEILRNILKEYQDHGISNGVFYNKLHTLVGVNTNHNWLMGRIFDEMFERDMIEEKQYYEYSAKVS